MPLRLPQGEFLRDGAEFDLKHPLLATMRESEMDVKCRGTAAISIQIAQGGKGRVSEFPLLKTTNGCLNETTLVLKAIESWIS